MSSQSDQKPSGSGSSSPKGKKPLAIIILAIVGVVAIAVYLAIITSPKHIAKEHFKALKNADWSAMYNDLDLNGGEMLTRKHFIAARKSLNLDYSDVNDFSVEEFQSVNPNLKDSTQSEDGALKFTVTYYEKGSTEPETMIITVLKKPGNKWLFFPNYKVDARDMITSCKISVITQSGVEIDGTDIKPFAKHTKEDFMDTYEIDSIFKGVHKVTITHAECKPFEPDFDLSFGSNELTVKELELNDDVAQKLKDRSEQLTKEFLKGAYEGKAFNELNIKMTSEEKFLKDLEEYYKSVCEKFRRSNGTGATDFKITSIKDQTSHKIDKIAPTTAFVCETSVTYTFRTIKSKDGTLVTNDQPLTRTGTLMPVYVLENDEWVLRNFYGVNFALW